MMFFSLSSTSSRVQLYRGHDVLQLVIDFVARPVVSSRVLRHFETGDGHSASVCSLDWEVDGVWLEHIDGSWCGRHISAFEDVFATALDECLRVILFEFILRGGRKRD